MRPINLQWDGFEAPEARKLESIFRRIIKMFGWKDWSDEVRKPFTLSGYADQGRLLNEVVQRETSDN